MAAAKNMQKLQPLKEGSKQLEKCHIKLQIAFWS
jgi:hypothetical protein